MYQRGRRDQVYLYPDPGVSARRGLFLRQEGVSLDNYLSYRWPGQSAAAVEEPKGRAGKKAARKAKKAAKKARRAAKKAAKRERKAARRRARRHPVLRGLLIALLILVLIGGAGVGAWFFARYVLPDWVDVTVNVNGEAGTPGSRPPLPESVSPSPKPTLSIPRAETGLGVTLTIGEESHDIYTASEIYRQVLPSVVSISVYKPADDTFGGGSGVIMREDGYILTNYHIIDGGMDAVVMLLEDSSVYPATLVGYDVELDIAILKIEATGLRAAQFGDSDLLQVGDPAYAIGNPLGLNGTMTDGIISYLDRPQTVSGHEMTLIQTSVILNSGNSGGALVNQHGQVVGIVVAKVSGSVSGSAMAEGIGFAIPITAARPYINRMLETGQSWKPTIGITCYAAKADGVPGIMVETVEAGTPAAMAGLRPKDFITHANGIPVDSVYGLKRVLGEVGVGGTLTCTVVRGEGPTEISFALIDGSELEK